MRNLLYMPPRPDTLPPLPLIGIDIPPRDSCFSALRIAIRARQQETLNCRLLFVGRNQWTDDAEVARRLCSCDGLIVFASDADHDAWVADLPLPAINVSSHLSWARTPRIVTDHKQMGRLAAEALLARGLRQLVSWNATGMGYTNWRLDGMREAITAAGAQLYLVDHIKQSARTRLADRKPPLGIIGINDRKASQALHQALEDGWQVPEQISVVGIDNNIQTCETAAVPISSIAADTTRWGRTLLDTIVAMVHGQPAPCDTVRIPPYGLVERDSLRHSANDDPLAARVMELLTYERALHWNSSSLAVQLAVSPATLDRHCRRFLGASAHRLILSARLERARRLLQDPNRSVLSVARSCGWASAKRLAAAFREAHDMTPSEWRRMQRPS